MSKIYDGNFLAPQQDGAKRVFYPLAGEGNYTAQVIERLFVVSATAYTYEPVNRYVMTVGMRSVTVPTTDPDNSAAFLVEEATDESYNQLGMQRFRRSYATVPSASSIPSSIIVSRPQIPGTTSFPRVYSRYLIDQPDATVESFNVYSLTNVTGDSGIPSFYPTGGTYSLSFDGYTTASLAYSATSGDVSIALNSLASVVSRGSVSVSGTYNSAGGFTATFTPYAAATVGQSITTTPAGGSISAIVNAFSNGRQHLVEISTPQSFVSPLPITIVTAALQYAITPSSWVTENYYGLPNAQADEARVAAGGNTVGPITGGSVGFWTPGGIITVAYDATVADVATALNTLGTGYYSAGPSSGGTIYAGNTTIRAYLKYKQPIITGGTYTFSIFGQTTASIAFDAVAATISTAVNALSGVTSRGGATVSGAGLDDAKSSISFVVSFNEPSITGTSALTPSSSIEVTSAANGSQQTLRYVSSSSIRTLVANSHGASNGGTLSVCAASVYYRDITNYSVIDENTIQLGILPSYGYASASSISEVGPLTKEAYEPGAKRVRATRTTSFYLPGYSVGITTADDIPIATDQSSDAQLLDAIFGNTGSINISVGDVEPYLYPILRQSVVTVNSADL